MSENIKKYAINQRILKQLVKIEVKKVNMFTKTINENIDELNNFEEIDDMFYKVEEIIKELNENDEIY